MCAGQCRTKLRLLLVFVPVTNGSTLLVDGFPVSTVSVTAWISGRSAHIEQQLGGASDLGLVDSLSVSVGGGPVGVLQACDGAVPAQ